MSEKSKEPIMVPAMVSTKVPTYARADRFGADNLTPGSDSEILIETYEEMEGDKKKVTYKLEMQNSGQWQYRSNLFSDESHCHSNTQPKNSLDKRARRKLIIASVLCLGFMIGEAIGGFLAHSLAIMSDAAHLLTDFASFMISLMALYLANRPATKKLSFGWYRAEILGAFISILMLWVLTGILVYSAVQRIIDANYEISGSTMLITAACGVVFNVVLLTNLHQHQHTHSHSIPTSSSRNTTSTQRGSGNTESSRLIENKNRGSYGSSNDLDIERGGSEEDLLLAGSSENVTHSHDSNINVKAAFVHVLGDLLQSIGVLVAAFIIYFKPEWKIADPICTFMFSVFVLITTITILRDILVVLMEGAPRGISFADVQSTFYQVEGVVDIHNLRLWSLTMDKIALSVHLAIDKKADPHRVLKMASIIIQQKFNISETTIQIEEYVTEMDGCKDCRDPRD